MNPAARKKTTAPVSRSSSSKKANRIRSLKQELFSIIMLIISVYALTCVLFTEGTGAFGALARGVLLGLFGPIGAIAIPGALAILFFFGRRLRRNKVLGRKIFFAVLAVISLISSLHLIISGIPDAKNAVDTVGDLWLNANDGKGGGVVGGLLALGLGGVIGRWFAAALLLLLSFILLSFAVGSTAYGIWTALGDLLCIERVPREPTPKGKKAKAERGRRGKKSAEPDPAEALRAIVTSGGFGDGESHRGSASGDIFAPETSAASTEGDEGEYGDYDDFYYSDSYVGVTSREAADTIYSPEAEIEDVYSLKEDTDKPYTTDEGFEEDRKASAPISVSSVASATASATAIATSTSVTLESEDTDVDEGDSDDTDPFERPSVVSKVRRFGRLSGRRVVRSDEEDIEETEKTIPPTAAAPSEKPSGEDGGEKKWQTGDRYVYPPTTLLNPIPENSRVTEAEVQEVAERILKKLESMRVDASLVGYSIGPAVTRYEIAPGEGVRVKKISQLINDISLELAAEGLRIEAPIPGKSAIGIEVPNKKVALVSFRALVENPKFYKAKSKITVCIGENIAGDVEVMDIDDMPHVLIAGQTKSGKSVAMNCMLLSLLYRVTPDEVKLILIDPKRVEFNIYAKIPHLAMPVIDDPTQAAAALSWAVKEMERRYDLMKEYNARNREEYLKKTAGKPDREAFPQIIIIIDELADMMLQVKEHVEPLINRIAAKARACGMHLLIGTQRPSTDVITGLIKANIPARISFKVAEQVDARIIGATGAEKLLGKGDLLYHPTGSAVVRAQGAYVDGDELNRVIDYIIENNGEASFDPEILAQLEEEENSMLRVKKRGAAGGGDEDDDGLRGKKLDPLLMNAIEIAVDNQSVSTSSLQRYLEIGYGRAAKLIDIMERLGIVGPPNGSKPREVLMSMEQYHIWKLEQSFD